MRGLTTRGTAPDNADKNVPTGSRSLFEAGSVFRCSSSRRGAPQIRFFCRRVLAQAHTIDNKSTFWLGPSPWQSSSAARQVFVEGNVFHLWRGDFNCQTAS